MKIEFKPIESVQEFHETFDHPVLPEPKIPALERCNLRVNLLQEELDELKEAISNNDIVGIADALCDLQYVLSGAVLEFGLGQKFPQLFNEVQRSNLSKTCESLEIAIKTQEHYKQHHQVDSYYVEKNGKWLVYRKDDNKTLKSVEYSKADLAGILNS